MNVGMERGTTKPKAKSKQPKWGVEKTQRHQSILNNQENLGNNNFRGNLNDSSKNKQQFYINLKALSDKLQQDIDCHLTKLAEEPSCFGNSTQQLLNLNLHQPVIGGSSNNQVLQTLSQNSLNNNLRTTQHQSYLMKQHNQVLLATNQSYNNATTNNATLSQ